MLKYLIAVMLFPVSLKPVVYISHVQRFETKVKAKTSE